MQESDPMQDYINSEEYFTYAKDLLLEYKTPAQMVKDFSDLMQQEPNPELYQKLIEEEFSELIQAWGQHATDHPDYREEDELKELADLVYVIFGYALTKGWDLQKALLLVHKNNVGRCIQPDGSIQRREDGKIIKNKDYPKIDLSHLTARG